MSERLARNELTQSVVVELPEPSEKAGEAQICRQLASAIDEIVQIAATGIESRIKQRHAVFAGVDEPLEVAGITYAEVYYGRKPRLCVTVTMRLKQQTALWVPTAGG